jgi:hypothetical protein
VTNMEKHFELPKASVAELPQLDTAKRYDIYCSELGRAVLYRNALFKAVVRLSVGQSTDFHQQFIQIEQENGQMVFLAKDSVFKFCEPGTSLMGGSI